MAAAPDKAGMLKVIDHIFLPPRLPQQEDLSSERHILDIATSALTALQAKFPPPSQASLPLADAVTLLRSLQRIQSASNGYVSEHHLLRELHNLQDGQTLAVHVVEQNAAVLVSRKVDKLLFEQFELSPANEAVYKDKGRLIRDFPAMAVAVDITLLSQADFGVTIAKTLATMSHQPVLNMQPLSRKAGSSHQEDRDSTKPEIVSGLFFGFLLGYGHVQKPDIIVKKTREEVMFQSARRPWRRSPMWLLLRVSLHLVLSRSKSGSHGLYKNAVLFIMSEILNKTLHLNLPAEMYYIMNCKIDRRRFKLAQSNTLLHSAVSQSVQKSLTESHGVIQKRWLTIQKDDVHKVDLTRLAKLDFSRETDVDLPGLDRYISEMKLRRDSRSVASFQPSLALSKKFDGSTLPTLPNGPFKAYTAASLQQFEQWVAQHLSAWVVAPHSMPEKCEKLCNLIQRYHALALDFYSGNPEGMSTMLLTIMELWVGCDQAAIQECGLLADYDPGIPMTPLQNLLLRFYDQMQRLSNVEAHLSFRARGKFSAARLFDMSCDNFANRFYHQSASHQDLHKTILSMANEAREAKIRELQQKKAEYARLNTLCIQTPCEYITKVIDRWCDPPETEEVHSRGCERCAYQRDRDKLEILVHEWPLPADSSKAKTIVFELQLPTWYSFWREARLFLLHTVLRGKRTQVSLRASYVLTSDDPHLARCANNTVTHRTALLSETKPVASTHYRGKGLAGSSEATICVSNGLSYQYWDYTTQAFLGEFEYGDDLLRLCTYALPERTQALQRFIFRPASMPHGPPPNEVIASQAACPESMTLDEYRELATLPLGLKIQWPNIIAQLTMPGVDFKKPETSLFFLQCIYQAGPAAVGSDVLREAHGVFHSETKALSLFKSLHEALQRVKRNWESSQALSTFVSIATRVLSLSRASTIKTACFSFLEEARNVAMNWMENLREKTFAATTQNERNEFVERSVETALICASTYDVDDEYLADILCNAESATCLIGAAIVVQQGTTTATTNSKLLHLRFERLLHRTYGIVLQDQDGLNKAIQNAWPAYQVNHEGWKVVSAATSHWLTTQTAEHAKHVHFDLLSGELLVNGLPIDQPPRALRDHPFFTTLFGAAVVKVMPATKAGFQCSAQQTFGGCSVQIGMQDDDLIVLATNSSSTFEIVPGRKLQGIFPRHFEEKYVLWYDRAGDAIEFRPIDDPWNASSIRSWILSRNVHTARWTLAKDGVTLLCMGSKTAQVIASILQPLAELRDIHCLLQPDNTLLHAEIPSLRHTFSAHEGSSSLRSLEYRSMEIDPDQSLASLIGFSNKLMLRSFRSGDRMTLVLQSQLHFIKEGEHVSVRVNDRSQSKVQAIEVDSTLHRMRDSGVLYDQLYMAYLHALTSYCLPDPLTRRTGTEQSLTILRSKAVKSFEQLSQEEVDLLITIAGLCPSRNYYPAHKRAMQTVDWNDELDFLAQHPHFSSVVFDLLQQSEFAKILCPAVTLRSPHLKKTCDDLRERASMRSSTYRVSGFGAEDHTTAADGWYNARDRTSSSLQASNATAMSALCMREGDAAGWTSSSAGHLWNLIKDYSSIYGAQHHLESSFMLYDAELLRSGFERALARLPALHGFLKSLANPQQHRFARAMWLSTLAFREGSDMETLQVLAMCSKSPALAQLVAPAIPSFNPYRGNTINKQALRYAMSSHLQPLKDCPESQMTRNVNEKHKAYNMRRERAWNNARDAAMTQMVEFLASQWRCKAPDAPTEARILTYVHVPEAMATARESFQHWYDHSCLVRYLQQIEEGMNMLPVQKIVLSMKTASGSGHLSIRSSMQGYLPEASLFSGIPPALPEAPVPLKPTTTHRATALLSTSEPRLAKLIHKVGSISGDSSYEQKYVEDLRLSLSALDVETGSSSMIKSVALPALQDHLLKSQAHLDAVYASIEAALFSVASLRKSYDVQRSPRISPLVLVKQLSHNHWPSLSEGWKSSIVTYGLALTAVQRAQRLLKLSESSQKEELSKELDNPGHTNWSPFDYPESLLIEIKSGITIRDVQERIAGEMRQPSCNANAVMQLNMGEGKSSVILPIVASALANGSQLVRIVVAKPQSKQMAQMLIGKLGTLVGRRVYYLPFSRSLRLSASAAHAIADMLRQCMSTGGILLVQPEQILSFKLVALECYTHGDTDTGRVLMSTQEFMTNHSRDLVDESDENFSTRFELIYTMGAQRSIELSPDRWILAQHLLDTVRRSIASIAQQHPGSVEITPGPPGSVPRIRLLNQDAETALVIRLAQQMTEEGIEGFDVSRQSKAVRDAAYKLIANRQPASSDMDIVQNSPVWLPTTRSSLLLVRGLLSGGVLGFCLGQKRWRVNYGPTDRVPSTRLAVPYRAKDSPSLRSEFSHPDVVIVLTTLSYYYQGLKDHELFASFSHLVDCDQAAAEYELWTRDSNALPTAFKGLEGINLKDHSQCTSDLFPCLRYSKGAIDYFLSHLVFPKELKEFPKKLSASGWEIGQTRPGLTTGFSGTMDSRHLLPLDMNYLDLARQKHTNALVLDYILDPNNHVHLMGPTATAKTDADHLLDVVMKLRPLPEVILDLGAQILELNNLEMAQTWLDRSEASKEAVIYVDDLDDIRVVDRKGQKEMFLTSSYRSRMDLCLVFLDEAHTRGIDIKLPVTYRAAVTLGANVTKDRLVQACMRMRKLGLGQTVVFCVSEEIQAKIRGVTSCGPQIEVADVLVWAIVETHNENRRNMPLWKIQGERFYRQNALWKAARNEQGKVALTPDLASKFLEDEAQSIDSRYSPVGQPQTRANEIAESDNSGVDRIAARGREFGSLQVHASTLQEEQERELSPEIERERQIERPRPAKAVEHQVHPDVKLFVETGRIVSKKSKAYGPAFPSLIECELDGKFEAIASQLGGDGRLLATRDFNKTIQVKSLTPGQFLRHVRWLLTRCDEKATIDCVMLLSPFEANQLFALMGKCDRVTLHLYKPLINSSYNSLDTLDFCTFPERSDLTMPRDLAAQLNLFAGQLYINSFADYETTCDFLGLLPSLTTQEMHDQGWQVGSDGFIACDECGRVGGRSGLQESPVPFLKALMRTRHEGFAKTHMSRLLEGKVLSESDFE